MLTSKVLHSRRCVHLALRLVPSVRTLKSLPGSAMPDLYAEAESTVWGAPCKPNPRCAWSGVWIQRHASLRRRRRRACPLLGRQEARRARQYWLAVLPRLRQAVRGSHHRAIKLAAAPVPRQARRSALPALRSAAARRSARCERRRPRRRPARIRKGGRSGLRLC